MPTRVFAKYQITHTLPYWFKRWVLFRRNARLEPLFKVELDKKHKLDGGDGGSQEE